MLSISLVPLTAPSLFIESVLPVMIYSLIAKSFKLAEYPCIPDWMKAGARDPFDYKLRSKEEVKEEFKYFAPEM